MLRRLTAAKVPSMFILSVEHNVRLYALAHSCAFRVTLPGLSAARTLCSTERVNRGCR